MALKKTRTSNHAGFAMLVWIFYTETIFLFAKRRMAKILIENPGHQLGLTKK